LRIAVCLSGLPRHTKTTVSSLSKYLPYDLYVHQWKGNLYPKAKRFLKEECLFDNNRQNMYYSIQQAHNLIEGKYDVVVRVRQDTLFSESIPQDELDDVVKNKNVIYVHGRHDIPDRAPELPKINFKTHAGVPYIPDQFAFGSQEAMKKYANTFLHTYSDDTCGEIVLGRSLTTADIEIKWSKINLIVSTG